MIVQQIDDNGEKKLVAIDSKGLYLTTQDRVDRPVADVNRYGVPRDEIYRHLSDLGLDTRKLFNANKHLIKSESTVNKTPKNLNPIKASKRGM